MRCIKTEACDLGVDLEVTWESTLKVDLSRLESLGSGRVLFTWGSSRILAGLFVFFSSSIFLTLGYFLQLCVRVRI